MIVTEVGVRHAQLVGTLTRDCEESMKYCQDSFAEVVVGEPRKQWICIVFRTIRQMHCFAKKIGSRKTRGVIGMCVPRKRRCGGIIGLMLFALNKLDADVVTHECVHAAIFSHRIGPKKPLTFRMEEKLCETSGLLSGQFWKRYRRVIG